MSKVENFTPLFLCIKAHYGCLRLRSQSGFVLMRQLIVAAPCVCCRRCCRRSSTPVWHQCLFQSRLTALVIKSPTDTTHHIAAVITSELHCVHKTVSLAEARSPPPLFMSSFFLSRHRFVLCLPRLSGISPVTNSFHSALIHSMIILSISWKKSSSTEQDAGLEKYCRYCRGVCMGVLLWVKVKQRIGRGGYGYEVDVTCLRKASQR